MLLAEEASELSSGTELVVSAMSSRQSRELEGSTSTSRWWYPKSCSGPQVVTGKVLTTSSEITMLRNSLQNFSSNDLACTLSGLNLMMVQGSGLTVALSSIMMACME
jgi:hypothetical protein